MGRNTFQNGLSRKICVYISNNSRDDRLPSTQCHVPPSVEFVGRCYKARTDSSPSLKLSI